MIARQHITLSLRTVALTLALLVAACGGERAVTRGAALYMQNCAICHGADMRGGGGAGVEGLSGTPADLTLLARDAGGVFPRARVVEIIGNYADGRQPGRIMQPFSGLVAEQTTRVRIIEGRLRVPKPQADLLAWIEAMQTP